VGKVGGFVGMASLVRVYCGFCLGPQESDF
jgi:hypothetical protein